MRKQKKYFTEEQTDEAYEWQERQEAEQKLLEQRLKAGFTITREDPESPEKTATAAPETHPLIDYAPIDGWVLEMQTMYIWNDWPTFPVMPESTRYFPERTPSNSEGLTRAEAEEYIKKGTKMFRTHIPDEFVVVDLDEKNGKHGILEFDKWLRENDIRRGALADINNYSHPFTVRTASGGLHLYFRLPEEMEKLKSITGFMPGVDLFFGGHALATAGSWKEGGYYVPNFKWLHETQLPELPVEVYSYALMQTALQAQEQEDKFFYAEGTGTRPRQWTKNPQDWPPERIFRENLKKWNTGKKKYGGHNEFFFLGFKECFHKGWEMEQAWQDAIDSEAYHRWGDGDKINQLKRSIRSAYNQDNFNPNGGVYGQYR